jgi:hypothetical protein
VVDEHLLQTPHERRRHEGFGARQFADPSREGIDDLGAARQQIAPTHLLRQNRQFSSQRRRITGVRAFAHRDTVGVAEDHEVPPSPVADA